eukprot:m.73241 g.73241  ORF g.73241 m.73241 type:complete len:109 (-) comp16120_c0_seq6:822-1148(-)
MASRKMHEFLNADMFCISVTESGVQTGESYAQLLEMIVKQLKKKGYLLATGNDYAVIVGDGHGSRYTSKVLETQSRTRLMGFIGKGQLSAVLNCAIFESLWREAGEIS